MWVQAHQRRAYIARALRDLASFLHPFNSNPLQKMANNPTEGMTEFTPASKMLADGYDCKDSDDLLRRPDLQCVPFQLSSHFSHCRRQRLGRKCCCIAIV